MDTVGCACVCMHKYIHNNYYRRRGHEFERELGMIGSGEGIRKSGNYVNTVSHMKLSKIKSLNNIGINDCKCSVLNRTFLLFIFET